MKKHIVNIFFLLFACLTSLSAKIVDVQHFREINSYITPDTIIILDIDDTLLIPEQMLGCDEWFKARMQKYRNEGMNDRNILELSLAEWEAVRHVTKMKIVEPGTDALVRDLQNKKYLVMGLTTQGLALATRTSQQLKANHFDLNLAAPFLQDHYVCLDEHGVLYRNGILFTSGRNKGKALFQLFKQNNYTPKRIVFINDKAIHLADVEEAAIKHQVEFIGLRYAYADAHKTAFRLDVADYQFTHSSFDRILTDEEAMQRLHHYDYTTK